MKCNTYKLKSFIILLVNTTCIAETQLDTRNALIRLFFDDVKNGRCPIQLTNPTHGDIKVQTGAALKQIVQTLQKNNEVGHFFPFVLTTRERNKWTFEHSIPNKKITLVIHLNAGVGGLTCSSSEIQHGVENQDKPLDLFLESNV